MKGYLNNSKATTEAFTDDGWVRSGDVGYVSEGKWYVIDRTKDLIKVRGWQVSPAEIESSLLEHPNIIDAAVIGMAAKDGCGEVPQAFIVRKEHSHLEVNEIKEFLGMRLARYKGVEEVQFVDRIPRNPTGKILRRVLRESRMAQAQPLTPDQVVASAYSHAIKDLNKIQQERNSERGSETQNRLGSLSGSSISEPPTPEALRPSHRRTESQASNLTETSAIDSRVPATPPPMDEVLGNIKTGRKRKRELTSPSTGKRRSARIGVVRDRAANE